ncbi:hypothetical protein RM717_30270 [Streptomyces griseus]|uniref:Uncharacterized protein n=1 Tax=Streptomyces stephensoniae TaxID=3375367 RepID=A0ABU2WCK8_9ACTN|nr:hypothetical protein [Streptomyces griseus]
MTTSCELREVRNEKRALCWAGTSEEFGTIEVRYPADGPMGSTTARVLGSAIPTTLLIGWSLFDDKPRLTSAQLQVEGESVKLRRNPWAVSRKGRSLRMEYGGTEYRCRAVRRKRYVFTRPGLVVTVTQSGIGRKRRRVLVMIDGPAEPIDISLAVLFSGVNRAQLTLGGAFRTGFATILTFATDNTGRV